MKDMYVIYSGKPHKRVILRRVSWWRCNWRNCSFHFKSNWKGRNHWFWHIQLCIFGVSKCNGKLEFRVLNRELEIGW